MSLTNKTSYSSHHDNENQKESEKERKEERKKERGREESLLFWFKHTYYGFIQDLHHRK
jgi:hypothetical protein